MNTFLYNVILAVDIDMIRKTNGLMTKIHLRSTGHQCHLYHLATVARSQQQIQNMWQFTVWQPNHTTTGKPTESSRRVLCVCVETAWTCLMPGCLSVDSLSRLLSITQWLGNLLRVADVCYVCYVCVWRQREPVWCLAACRWTACRGCCQSRND